MGLTVSSFLLFCFAFRTQKGGRKYLQSYCFLTFTTHVLQQNASWHPLIVGAAMRRQRSLSGEREKNKKQKRENRRKESPKKIWINTTGLDCYATAYIETFSAHTDAA